MSMTNKDMKELFNISQMLRSKKRVVLFIFLDKPIGFTRIEHEFKKHGVKIGSSEIYKHIKILIKGGWIERIKPQFETSRYIRSKKGDVLLKKLKMFRS